MADALTSLLPVSRPRLERVPVRAGEVAGAGAARAAAKCRELSAPTRRRVAGAGAPA